MNLQQFQNFIRAAEAGQTVKVFTEGATPRWQTVQPGHQWSMGKAYMIEQDDVVDASFDPDFRKVPVHSTDSILKDLKFVKCVDTSGLSG